MATSNVGDGGHAVHWSPGVRSCDLSPSPSVSDIQQEQEKPFVTADTFRRSFFTTHNLAYPD